MKTIPLTKGKHAIVDDEDFERVSAYKWLYDGDPKGYGKVIRRFQVARVGKKQVLGRMRLPNFILNMAPEQTVDHINCDTLDNRKENLRLCSKTENNQNKPKREGTRFPYKGIVLNLGGSYQAQIRANGKRLCLGSFNTVEAAARAYDEAAKTHHGEFANLNFK